MFVRFTGLRDLPSRAFRLFIVADCCKKLLEPAENDDQQTVLMAADLDKPEAGTHERACTKQRDRIRPSKIRWRIETTRWLEPMQITTKLAFSILVYPRLLEDIIIAISCLFVHQIIDFDSHLIHKTYFSSFNLYGINTIG